MGKICSGKLAMTIALTLFIAVMTGGGCSDSQGLSLQEIPRYPNAIQGESMEHSAAGGIVGGKMAQFTTEDTFDEVLAFYTDALGKYEPKYLSHTAELGRQTAISIAKKKGMISVAIQEFTEEGTVNITFMAVGR